MTAPQPWAATLVIRRNAPYSPLAHFAAFLDFKRSAVEAEESGP
jgi:hypothetical protein